jgi:hypothetical protein
MHCSKKNLDLNHHHQVWVAPLYDAARRCMSNQNITSLSNMMQYTIASKFLPLNYPAQCQQREHPMSEKSTLETPCEFPSLCQLLINLLTS